MNTETHFEKDYQYHQAIASEYDFIVVGPRVVANQLLFNKLSSLITPNSCMLDLACGTGHMTYRFGSRFQEVVAVDHSDAMLAQAQSKAPLLKGSQLIFKKKDINQFIEETEKERFDFIACTGFLHHLLPQQIGPFLKRVNRILKPNGKMLISEPIKTLPEDCPEFIKKWNRRSFAATINYSVEAVEPDEEPIEEQVLMNAISDGDFKIQKKYRSWEVFPLHNPPVLSDWAAIGIMNQFFNKKGNVFTALIYKK